MIDLTVTLFGQVLEFRLGREARPEPEPPYESYSLGSQNDFGFIADHVTRYQFTNDEE